MYQKYRELLRAIIALEFNSLSNREYWNRHYWKLANMCSEWDSQNGTR